MRLFHKNSRLCLILAAILISVTMLSYSATPEKPYPALEEGDRLNAYWLMGMFNVLYDWAQDTNNTVTQHHEATAAHGATGAVVGTENAQTLTNKTLGDGSTWSGNAISLEKGGTGATSAAGARTNLAVGATLSRGSGLTGNDYTGAAATTWAVSFGNAAGTVCQGNDSRLSDSRTPVSHVHGNITNDGKVGATSGLPLITTTGGAVTAGSFGTGAGTFCQGNDARLSDARTPTTHTHNYAGSSSAGGAANSVAYTLTRGTGLTGSNYNGSAAQTWAVSFGTTAGTACQGNDARLSDARTPTTHTHNYAGSSSAGGAATTAETANKVRTSAPGSPANGDIWLE